ncbi:uncharacterized protein K441DRAFT_697880 [Cenococcum geophilum 1.58]|uniref:uncharacterized protein n=1 Tax=Cenococcum geophilum 1.58 TaxID=794803 RepID=UPI00359014B4|nr:hypothetical protein K441DRAFT_697880 [Cenococcum geophilum 1.58]
MASITRPRVFLDVSVGTEPIGRLVIELFVDKAPKTCENFRTLCTGSNPPLTYKMSPFHRIIDEFMIQGGDITKGDGTGGTSIYGEQFEDENIGWREIDAAGLVCMANRGRNTNGSQFFITLAPCTHLNAKHTVFGHLVSGQPILEQLASLQTDKDDRPLTPVLISNSGELERRTKTPLTPPPPRPPPSRTSPPNPAAVARRRAGPPTPLTPPPPPPAALPPLRQPPPPAAHPPSTISTAAATPPPPLLLLHLRVPAPAQNQRAQPPPQRRLARHTLRGRPRQRSRSRTRSPLPENMSPAPRHRRQRSPPPSRSRRGSVEGSPRQRRQRSLPNQYYDDGYGRQGGRRGERDDEAVLRRGMGEGGGEGRFEGRGGRRIRGWVCCWW